MQWLPFLLLRSARGVWGVWNSWVEGFGFWTHNQIENLQGFPRLESIGEGDPICLCVVVVVGCCSCRSRARAHCWRWNSSSYRWCPHQVSWVGISGTSAAFSGMSEPVRSLLRISSGDAPHTPTRPSWYLSLSLEMHPRYLHDELLFQPHIHITIHHQEKQQQ